MGATECYRDRRQSDREFFAAEFGIEIVDLAKVGSVVYIVAEKNGERFAVIAETWWRGDWFTYSDSTEHMGPYHYDCPARLLDLLPPINDEYANKWRQECRERAAAKQAAGRSRRQVRDGSVIRFSNPIRFSNGAVLDTFTVSFAGRKRYFIADGQRYIIRNWTKTPFEIV